MSFFGPAISLEGRDPFWLAKKMRKTQFGDNKNRHKLSRQEITEMMKKQQEANASAAVSFEGEGTSGELAAGGSSEASKENVSGPASENDRSETVTSSERSSDIGSSANDRETFVVVS